MGHDCHFLPIFVMGLSLASAFAIHAQSGQKKPSPPPPSAQAKEGTLSGTWLLKSMVLSSGNSLLPVMQAELKFHRIVLTGEKSGTFKADEMVMFEDKGQPTITCHQSGESTFTVVRVADHNFIRLGPPTLRPGSDCGRYAGKTGTMPDGGSSMFEMSGDTLTFIDNGGGDGVILRIYKRVQP